MRARGGHGRRARLIVPAAVLALIASGCLWIRPVSVTPSGTSGNGTNSYSAAAVSADGRWVAFESWASDLVPGAEDAVFVRDTRTGRTSVVSVRADGSYGEGGEPAISPDGRFVAFVSSDASMVAGLNGKFDQIFIRDRVAGTTRLVSIKRNGASGNGDSAAPSVSADGRFVAFHSDASNLVHGDGNLSDDVFVRDLALATTARLNVEVTGGEPFFGADTASITPDARFVVFSSLDEIAGVETLAEDVYIREIATGAARLVSSMPGGGPSNGFSSNARVTPNGRFVAFTSTATNLVSGGSDGNAAADVFLADLATATTIRVSRSNGGGAPNGPSTAPSVSADGRFVAYASAASNIVAGDVNGATDTFVFDRATGRTVRVDTDQHAAAAVTGAALPVLSADGRYVVFASAAPLTGPNPVGVDQLFIREVSIPEIETLSPALLTRGTTTTVIITGQGFLAVTTASANGAGVTVDSTANYGDGALVLSISVAATAPTGSGDLKVRNVGTGPGPGATSVVTCAGCITVQ